MLTQITEFLTGTTVWVYLFIFLGKMIEVALACLRSIMMTKGQPVVGSIISVFEYAIWLCITGTALAGFASDPLKMLVLTAAYAAGQLLGAAIEGKIALGYIMLTVIFFDCEKSCLAIKDLRDKGFAVTTLQGEGREQCQRNIALLVIKRKDEKSVKKMLRFYDNKVVINSSMSNGLLGGRIPGKS